MLDGATGLATILRR